MFHAMYPFWSFIISVLLAQGIKPFLPMFKGSPFRSRLFFASGGMPSSHTAGVTALTTSVGILTGIDSIYFAICFVFSIIVIHDSLNIRLEAGKHAKVINEWSEILSNMHKGGPFEPTNLKTFLGHSFSQVLGGFLLGLIIGCLITLNLS